MVETTITEGVAMLLKFMIICNLRTTQAMDSPEVDIMLVGSTTKEMLAITLQTKTNSSILSSYRIIRISGAMEDREDTQVVV